MPEGEGTPKKKARKKRRVQARSRPKAERASAGKPEENGSAPAAEWSEIYDRAAKKLSDLADQAGPAANRAQEAAKRMAVDLSGGLESAHRYSRSQRRDRAIM